MGVSVNPFIRNRTRCRHYNRMQFSQFWIYLRLACTRAHKGRGRHTRGFAAAHPRCPFFWQLASNQTKLTKTYPNFMPNWAKAKFAEWMIIENPWCNISRASKLNSMSLLTRASKLYDFACHCEQSQRFRLPGQTKSMMLLSRASKLNDSVHQGDQSPWFCLPGHGNSMTLHTRASTVNYFACQVKQSQWFCMPGQTKSMTLLTRASKLNNFACQGKQSQLFCLPGTKLNDVA